MLRNSDTILHAQKEAATLSAVVHCRRPQGKPLLVVVDIAGPPRGCGRHEESSGVTWPPLLRAAGGCARSGLRCGWVGGWGPLHHFRLLDAHGGGRAYKTDKLTSDPHVNEEELLKDLLPVKRLYLLPQQSLKRRKKERLLFKRSEKESTICCRQ